MRRVQHMLEYLRVVVEYEERRYQLDQLVYVCFSCPVAVHRGNNLFIVSGVI